MAYELTFAMSFSLGHDSESPGFFRPQVTMSDVLIVDDDLEHSMDRIAYLFQKARQCRRLAQQTTDTRAAAILRSTAESYEAQAEIAKRDERTSTHMQFPS